MKCKDCDCCCYGWFPDKPNEYVCIGVKEPFIIKNINGECTEYPEKNEVNKMNRYICKAKRLDTDEWVYGYFTMHCGIFVANTPVIENEDSDYMVNPDTVCRYTGWHDSNKTPIFENDIVEISGTNVFRVLICWCNETNMMNAVPLDGIEFNGYDYWNGKYSRYNYSSFCFDMQDPYGMFKEIKVIGNIIDNPELLKGDEING